MPEQFMPQVTKSYPKVTLGLPSLVLLSEQKLEKKIIEVDTKDIDVKDVVTTSSAKKDLKSFPKLVTSHKVEEILDNNKITASSVKVFKTTGNAKIDTKPVEKIIYTCFKSGPYTRINIAEKIVDWLKKRDGNTTVTLKKKVSKKLIKTQVYLPPFESLKKAKQTQESLYKAGIKEHYIVRNKSENSISLGVYSVQTNAKIRVNELKTKGYNSVKVREIFKESTNYWLNIKVLSDNLPDSFNKKFRDFTLTSVACDFIALQQFHELGETTLLNE
ncbi:MAG: hypothetical protein KAG43_03445 [Candidatus Marithrix sp.]|nr:hypothetical protein [Candidatus Marithrix sp.]